MKMYCLYENLYEGVQIRLDQLKCECEKFGIEFITINSSSYDYTNIPELTKSDLLYNASRGSVILETLLINDNVTTYYINKPNFIAFDPSRFAIKHEKAGILAPKTIFHFTNERKLLKKYVEYLGGFPIILKANLSTRGLGTIKIESWQNLISTADYIVNSTNKKFILRQFIPAKNGCRLIVLGNEVIAGADFLMNENDFRNAAIISEIKYRQKDFPKKLKDISVKATHLCNVEFSGVDFLEAENGDYYLLEVNFPTGFSGLIDVCGINIPEKMVKYLIDKSKKNG